MTEVIKIIWGEIRLLTNSETKILIDMLKKQKKMGIIEIPQSGEKKKIEIVSKDEKEQFLVDINRGSIDIYKCTYQERYNKHFPLIRLDISENSFHRNPDGKKIKGSHIHIYEEGYDMRKAYKIPDGIIKDKNDIIQTLIDFLEYCNVEEYGEIIEQGRIV